MEREPVAGAAGEADEPLVQLVERLERDARLEEHAVILPFRPRTRVGSGEDPAEVRVPPAALTEQGDVRAAFDRDLGAGDRADAELLRRVRELERAVDAVVVGQRERRIAERGRPGGQLLRMGRPVEERVRRMAVELDVGGSGRGHTALS